MAADLTVANSDPQSRVEQAAEFKAAGYGGPVGGGEARALKNLFTELGQPELIKRGWAQVDAYAMRKPSRWAMRQAKWSNQQPPAPKKVATVRLQHCFLFKSPIDGVPFTQFIKLARMYKDDSGKLKVAVKALLANPEAHKEIESLNALEILGGLAGME